MAKTATHPSGAQPAYKLCFVIGPIGKEGTTERKHSDLLLHAVIKHSLQTEELSYKVKRADEDTDPGMIGDRVISDIINADLVVADLTDLNPNAFYELGIRHSTEKPTIHIARSGTNLPFDNISHRTIFVDLSDWNSIEQARSRLTESVRAVTTKDYVVTNPITQANASFRMRQSEDPRERLIAELHERLSSLENALTNSTPHNSTKFASSEVEIAFISEVRRLWKRGVRSPKIEAAARQIAKRNGIEISRIAVDGSDLTISSPQLDFSGFDLDWEPKQETK
ncbi:hypothetical protein [Rhodopseudomonas parapalustris]